MAKRKGVVKRAIDAVTGKKPGKARRASTKKSASTGAAPTVVVETSATPAPVAPAEQIVRVGRTPGVVVGGRKRKRMPTKKSERKKAKKGLVSRMKARLGFGKSKGKKSSGGGKRRSKRGKSASTGMVLYHAREVAPGMYEAAPPTARKGKRKSSGAMVPRSSGGGGMLAKPKGMEYLTLGVTAVGGAPLGYWLQNQAQVPIPFTSMTIGRGSLASLVSLITTLVFRKWKPKVARHTAALTIGTAGGVLLQKRAARAEGSTTV